MELAAAEARIIVALQAKLAGGPIVAVARVLSGFGEHALGWICVGTAGALLDRRRARAWAGLAAAAVVGHGLAVVTKRVVRRTRPKSSVVRVLACTPSELSFPSAHAASTTAAGVMLFDLCRPAAVTIPPAMGLARVVLGVHYPSDVLTGAAIGGLAGGAARRIVRTGSARSLL